MKLWAKVLSQTSLLYILSQGSQTSLFAKLSDQSPIRKGLYGRGAVKLC